MSLHYTVLRARELFVLRMRTLAIQYPDPWGKSAIPNKENSPPCPGWGGGGGVGLTLIGVLCRYILPVKFGFIVNCAVSALTHGLIARKLCHGTAQDSR